MAVGRDVLLQIGLKPVCASCRGYAERRAPDGRPEGIERPIEYRTDLFERSSVEAVGRRLALYWKPLWPTRVSRLAGLSSLPPKNAAKFSSSGTTRPAICHRPRCRRCSRPRWSAVLKQSRCSLNRARAPHAQPTGGVLLCADAGGIGAPMCDQLASDFGIFARRINNNSPADKPQEFTNQDAERWFSFRRALEKRLLILPADGELMKQLSSRRLQYDHKA